MNNYLNKSVCEQLFWDLRNKRKKKSSQGSIENYLVVSTAQSICSEEIPDARDMAKAASRNSW